MAHPSHPPRDATSFASSSTSPSHSGVYDVFISHFGPDVKKGLASHIYHRLKDFGLAVFLDQQEMQEAENTTTLQIKRSIRTASVHIAIFYPGYADSPWCLDELLDMLDSRSTILPVFYNVQPLDPRWTRGGDRVYAGALSIFLCILLSVVLCIPMSFLFRFLLCVPFSIIMCILLCTRGKNGVYARALGTHQMKLRHDSDTIEKWRKALSDVSLTSGFELEACNGDEGQLVDKVVQGVLEILPKLPLDVAKYPTGLVEKVKDLVMTASVQLQSGKPSIVGIVGFGGVGKTTLAKEFFNCERANYGRSCFLFDVRSTSLHTLQSILLKDLTLTNVSINKEEGKEELKRHLASLTSQKVFMVLDDVDHIDQLDALLSPLKDTINLDSLILVTSRNKDVLTSSGITESSIYPLKSLNRQHSQELFCLHAFGQAHPVVGFEEVVEKFLDACHGLPLSLEVRGRLFREKYDLQYWSEQLLKIPSEIRSTLEISYDALDEQEKQIFLDIACFFIGEDRDTAIRIWDGSDWEGWLGLWKLENRCLVEVDSENRLRMHDQLRDLGRELAENSEYPRRLWRLTDGALHNVSDQSPVRGISMVHGNGSEQSFKTLAGSCNLSNCNLLRAESHFVEQVFSKGQLPPLIYLRWENCPKSSLRGSLPSRNLRVLHIEGKQLKTLWQHGSQAPLQLRELYVDAPLSEVPESIGKLKYLEKIVLYNGNMTFLPDSVENLTSLQSLHLSGCSTLQTLPDSVGNLTGLQILELSGCSNLHMMPSMEHLSSLETLSVYQCPKLQWGSGVIKQLRQRLGDGFIEKTLKISNDAILSYDALDKEEKEIFLDIACFFIGEDRDTAIRIWDGSDWDGRLNLQNLQNRGLVEVDSENCLRMHDHLRDLGRELAENSEYPRRLWRPTDSLHNVSDQSLVRGISMVHGNGSEQSFENLARSYNLSNCNLLRAESHFVEQVFSNGQLPPLIYLRWENCPKSSLPPSLSLMNLRVLHIEGKQLKTLWQDESQAPRQLRELYVDAPLSKIPDSIGKLKYLEKIVLYNGNMTFLPDSIGKLTSLQSLDLSGCSTLKTLPDSVGNLTGLLSLQLNGCSTPRLGWEPHGPPKSRIERVLHFADTPRLGWEPHGPQMTQIEQVLHSADGPRLGWEPDGPPKSQIEGVVHSADAPRLGWEPDGPPKSLLGQVLHSADAPRLGWEPDVPPNA